MKFLLTNTIIYAIIIYVIKRLQIHRQEERKMQDGMTNDQLNTLLETIAKLIEAEAITVQQAAQIVRDAKTK